MMAYTLIGYMGHPMPSNVIHSINGLATAKWTRRAMLLWQMLQYADLLTTDRLAPEMGWEQSAYGYVHNDSFRSDNNTIMQGVF